MNNLEVLIALEAEFSQLPTGTVVYWSAQINIEDNTVKWRIGSEIIKTVHIQDGVFYLPTGTGHKFAACNTFNKKIKPPLSKIQQFNFGGMKSIFARHFLPVQSVWISSEIEAND